MYFGLHVKYALFFYDLKKNLNFLDSFEKYSNINVN